MGAFWVVFRCLRLFFSASSLRFCFCLLSSCLRRESEWGGFEFPWTWMWENVFSRNFSQWGCPWTIFLRYFCVFVHCYFFLLLAAIFFFLQKSKCYVLERNVACVSRFLLEIHEIAFASFSPPASFPLNFCLSRNEDWLRLSVLSILGVASRVYRVDFIALFS